MIKNKKLIIIVVILLVAFLLLIFIKKALNTESKELDNEVEFEKIVELSEYVITTDSIVLYTINDGNYEEIGTISNNVVLHLSDLKNGYYQVLDLDRDYYVDGNNLTNYQEKIVYDDRYKNYIVFNNNVKTEGSTYFYDEDDNLVYKFNQGYSLPIIIKENDKYGVEFGNRILYIKSNESSMIDSHNTDERNINGIATLNYHAFYDENNEQEKKECNTIICHSLSLFKSHLELIEENNILTLKMKEVEMYIDGKIQLPKSVLITIDDGGRTQPAIDLLTEYKMNATLFLVTSWYVPDDYSNTYDYIEFHSHSDNLHNVGDCPTGQGGGIQCLDEEYIQNDLKTSREKLNNTTYFCYPFYEYNDYSIEMLKKAGFTMAFAGQSNELIKVGSDKYRLPRYVINTYVTIDDLSYYFGQMK